MEEIEYENALKVALNYQKFRPRSEKEVFDKLRSKDFNSTIIDRVIENLKESLILNDDLFAQMWAESRINTKNLGSYKISQELRIKGIDDKAIEVVLNDIYAEKSEFQYAYSFLEKRFLVRPFPPDEKKVIQLLVRRGYSYSLSKMATEAYITYTQNTTKNTNEI